MKRKEMTIIDKFKTVGGLKYLAKLQCPNCMSYKSVGYGILYYCKLLPQERYLGQLTYEIVAPKPCLYSHRNLCPLLRRLDDTAI